MPDQSNTEARSDSCNTGVMTPMEHFEKYCEPMLRDQKEVSIRLSQQLDDLKNREQLRIVSDSRREDEIKRIAVDLREISTDLRKVFRDGNGNSLISQVHSLADAVAGVQNTIDTHISGHETSTRSWRIAIQRGFITLVGAAIVAIVGYAAIGLQYEKNHESYVELRKLITDLQQAVQTQGVDNANY